MYTYNSPDRKILQVKYAEKAVSNGYTVIGMRGKDCVVLAAYKIIESPLYELDADERIRTINENIGMAISGFAPDGLVVASVARGIADKYQLNFNRTIPLQKLCEGTARFVHGHTRIFNQRPLGMSATLASWDAEEGPKLFRIEPSGALLSRYACASGRAEKKVMKELDKVDNFSDWKTEELVKKAGEIIYKCHFDKWNRDFRFEMGVVGKDTGGLYLFNPKELTEMARAAGEAATSDSSSSDGPFL